MARKKIERNDWGFDLDARVVSVNELYDLYDLIDEMIDAKYKELQAEKDPWARADRGGELSGLLAARTAVNDFSMRFTDRLPRK